MDQVWLLRIGLTLTLLASLMITPDLVGIARWERLQRIFSGWTESLKEALAKLGSEPNLESGLFGYLAKVLSDFVGVLVLWIVAMAAGLLLLTIAAAFLVASWLGAAVLAAWGCLFVVVAWALQVRRVLHERSQRSTGSTLVRLLGSPATGSVRFAADWSLLLLMAATQARMLACRRAARAAGSVASALTREGALSGLLLPTGLLCLTVWNGISDPRDALTRGRGRCAPSAPRRGDLSEVDASSPRDEPELRDQP